MSCLPTGSQYLSSNFYDLKAWYYKNPRAFTEGSVLGYIEDFGKFITVIPAHALTACVFAPIAFVYDIAMACLFAQVAQESTPMQREFEVFCLSSLNDICYLTAHLFASICPCCVYEIHSTLNNLM
jgi:hypothetical protein